MFNFTEKSFHGILQFCLRALGAYGLIIVFAQDIGLPTGPTHKEVIKNPIWQFLMFVSVAFAVTDDYYQAFMGAILYYIINHS
tara:strand:- start:193 stop:441 length:249 start_codon:yes stop_codon:yes gene_type:complete